MQVRLSGLRGVRDEHGRDIAEQVAPLPERVLRRFASRLREVALHVLPNSGDLREPALARLQVRRRHGPPLVASARAATAPDAVRAALAHARRQLRRDLARRRSGRCGDHGPHTISRIDLTLT